MSELEIENEKLRKDILLLRNSIDRGIAEKELEGTQQFFKLFQRNQRWYSDKNWIASQMILERFR